jgi:hypothetical protein
MRLFLAFLVASFGFAGSASAQVFYPHLDQTRAYMPYDAADNLDLTFEVEGFTTNWGEGYSGISYGVDADLHLSPSVSLEFDGKKLDTNLGTAYEYGAGINIHGPRGELYASINSLTAQPDGLAPRDKTWVDVGGEYAVNDNFRIGFEASTTIDGAVVPYESIYAPKALHHYR